METFKKLFLVESDIYAAEEALLDDLGTILTDAKIVKCKECNSKGNKVLVLSPKLGREKNIEKYFKRNNEWDLNGDFWWKQAKDLNLDVKTTHETGILPEDFIIGVI